MTSFSASATPIPVADYSVTYLFGVKDGSPDSYGKVPMTNVLYKDTSGFFPANALQVGAADWTGGYAGISVKTTVSLSRSISAWHTQLYGSAILARVDVAGANFAEFFYGAASSIGSISTNGTSTSFNTSSDYRLKEDVVSVATPLTRLNNLNPVNFRWKSSGARVDGFLAHELASVVPDAVTGAKDAVDGSGNPIYQGIDQSKLVPLLVAAVQELSALVEAQEARIAALEAA